ncbi:chitobiase/beta-hexosaminidase C-terminal domain-containing protein [Chryseobacterium indologenes]|uniref:chitobiase/beta-hexosaminidase C-terminal domain-containing protein n=1 Tax=Chryseobacterium indologenes TaxID=253 RepID=UPI0023E82342|nr:chitobiase/beta-hexosaminidase C-terminal domain-containing protein [Chryseobacterium indologenes]WET51474.1 chitobiase/beta-hexosaminidase C-terminal domain-containing protein [Chryseobacterium indologenes]
MKKGLLALSLLLIQIMEAQNNSQNMDPLKGTEILTPLSQEAIASPIIKADRIFDFSTKVEITSQNPGDKIYYMTLDAGDINKKKKFTVYKKPFTISRTTQVKAYVERKREKSTMVIASFNRRPNYWEITTLSKVSPQYTATGKFALIDGIRGDLDWKKGDWQGYLGQNFEAVIDFQSPLQITHIASTYLQDHKSLILMPKKVEYYASMNAKDFFLLDTIENDIDPKDEKIQTKDFTTEVLPTEARYLKVKAYYSGKLPGWRQKTGGETYIFVDEISVK